MVTGRRGGPGDDAHVLVVVELNRGLDLAPILHQPLVAQDVLDHEARHEVVMKSHSAQVMKFNKNWSLNFQFYSFSHPTRKSLFSGISI